MKKPDIIDCDYGKNIYEFGFTNGFNYWETFALAQYLRWTLGYKARRMEKYILTFCLINDPNFNSVINISTIKSAVNNALKKMPEKNEPVVITHNEIAKIKSVKNYQHQKLLFTMIVFAKRNKYDSTYINKRRSFIGYRVLDKDVSRICKKIGLGISENNIFLFLHNFVKLGLLEGTFGESSRILFADDSGKPLIRVGGDEDPIKKYVEFNGGEFIYCENCGTEIEKKSNRHKLCNSCSREKQAKLKKEYWKNIKKTK